MEVIEVTEENKNEQPTKSRITMSILVTAFVVVTCLSAAAVISLTGFGGRKVPIIPDSAAQMGIDDSLLIDRGGVVPPISKEAHFRVMSFNIRRDFESDGVNQWKYRVPLVTEILRKEAPDIVGMQEVLPEQMPDIAAMLPGYTMVGVGRDDGKNEGEFVPLFFRNNKFEAIKTGFFWLSETPRVPGTIYRGAGCTRVTSWALLRPKGHESNAGVDILAVSTHLDHVSEMARNKGAQVILLEIRKVLDAYATKTRGTTVVLVGDFNAEPQEKALSTLLSDSWKVERSIFSDSRLSAVQAPEGREIGTFPSWNPRINGKVIDYVLYAPTPLACLKAAHLTTPSESLSRLTREARECLKYTLMGKEDMEVRADQYRVVIDPRLADSKVQPSDHRPVVVDFHVGPAPSPALRTRR
uniref:Endonuclease/exonuclease/phosphatase domain-containing protein n=1 Tax=Lotharella oceanica TaxID=641309 RepID=A0A7S2U280_9EUKA|mmetsp:Transcript_6302/g.12540  ORF Transcript_6302/g.12540 Transcript_6302/m.12540 type:complete len:412 (+) Transcript_6302:73-1308(+)